MSQVLIHGLDPTVYGATFSACRRWRYRLWRRWEPGPTVLFCGLNPSIASEEADDPTIRREIDFAKRWGFGALLKVNLFGIVSTDPMGLARVEDPIGPANDAHIADAVGRADLVVAAWGCGPGKLRSLVEARAERVRLLMPAARCLGLTKDGQPRHPLYLAKSTALQVWRRG